MEGIERKRMVRSLGDKGFKNHGGARHDRWFFYLRDHQSGQEAQTWINVSIGRGKGHAIYRMGLLKYVKQELQLATMKETKDFLLCPMERGQYETLVRPLLELPR